MSAATQARSPTARANIAARMLVRNKTLGRAFDDCFEMGDGDQVVCRLVHRADQDPAFARVLRDRGFGNWLERDYRASVGARPPEPTLEERFAECCESFRAHIRGLAGQHGKPWQQVYQWWRDYTRSCETGDQSPVLGEFEQWYDAKLKDPNA